MQRIPATGVLLLAAVTFLGCDRTPTDPALDAEPVLLGESPEAAVFAPSATSLEPLLRTAVASIERERGSSAARRMLADWQRLQAEARLAVRSGQRVDAQARVAAIRAEEIRIVLLVLGNHGARHVIEAVSAAHHRLRAELDSAAAAGRNVMRARQLAVPVSDLLQRAHRAWQARDAATALDLATQASDRLDEVTHFLIALDRIPALETLYAEVIATVERVRGRDGLTHLLGRLNQLNEEARAAMLAADRAAATRTLEAARREQIRIVLEQRGHGVVGPVIEAVDTMLASTRLRLKAMERSRLIEHAQRMLAEASDLNARARQLRLRGDHAGALDLASHAAGLVNAAQHLIPR